MVHIDLFLFSSVEYSTCNQEYVSSIIKSETDITYILQAASRQRDLDYSHERQSLCWKDGQYLPYSLKSSSDKLDVEAFHFQSAFKCIPYIYPFLSKAYIVFTNILIHLCQNVNTMPMYFFAMCFLRGQNVLYVVCQKRCRKSNTRNILETCKLTNCRQSNQQGVLDCVQTVTLLNAMPFLEILNIQVRWTKLSA